MLYLGTCEANFVYVLDQAYMYTLLSASMFVNPINIVLYRRDMQGKGSHKTFDLLL